MADSDVVISDVALLSADVAVLYSGDDVDREDVDGPVQVGSLDTGGGYADIFWVERD